MDLTEEQKKALEKTQSLAYFMRPKMKLIDKIIDAIREWNVETHEEYGWFHHSHLNSLVEESLIETQARHKQNHLL